MGAALRPVAFPNPDRDQSAEALASHPGLLWLQTRSQGLTPAVHLKVEGSKFTLLCTHGNSEDVGELLPSYEELSQVTGLSLLAVEYPGYSISEAEDPSEEGLYEAVEAAYAHLVVEEGLTPWQVIAFGRSLGSVPAVHVAATYDCGGLVLQSPLESGLRCVFRGSAAMPVSAVGKVLDPFQNYEKLESVACRTLVIHGISDAVVPCQNGRNLHKQMEERGLASRPVWIPGCGHDDIPEPVVYHSVQRLLKELAPDHISSL